MVSTKKSPLQAVKKNKQSPKAFLLDSKILCFSTFENQSNPIVYTTYLRPVSLHDTGPHESTVAIHKLVG